MASHKILTILEFFELLPNDAAAERWIKSNTSRQVSVARTAAR